MSSTNSESFARLLRLRAESEPLRIEVSGSSMGRTIITGSSVVISGSRRPRWGEIWAFCDSATTVKVHRFVGRRNGRNRFWGDGNSSADGLVDDTLLIGRVEGIEAPDGSYRTVTPRRQMFDACVVGARRLPRRLAYRGWYGVRALLRRTKR